MGFFTTKVEILALKERLRENPELFIHLQNIHPDETVIDEYADKKLNQKTDDFLTIQILGEQGSGKSGVGQFFASKYAKVKFTADRISLQYEGFLDLVSTSKRGEFTILDEQTKSFGTGSNRLRGDIINIIETLRQHGASMILISPTEKMIGEKDVHFSMEVLARDGARVLMAWKSRSERFLGCFIVTLEWNNQLWQEYMTIKRSYVDQAKQMKFVKNDYEKLALKIMEHEDYPHAKTARELTLILEKEVPNMTTEEKKLIIAQIKLFQKKT